MHLGHQFAAGSLVALVLGCASQKASPPPPPTASTEFDKVKDPPINAKTHFAAAQLAESQGHLPEAVDQYKQALRLDAHYVDATFRLGVVYTQMKDFPAAVETWNQYIRMTPGSANGYSNLGFCQELAGNNLAAEGAYRRGIEKEPKNEACRVNYGLMLARHGRPNEGLIQLLAALPPASAHYDLASVFEQTGRKKDAKSEYQKALALDPALNDAKARLASLGE